MKIAIIGTGNLGLSIAKGLLINNSITTLYLTKRNPDSLKDWNKSNQVKVSSDNIEAVRNSDILIFAVQPIHMEKILNDVKHVLNEMEHRGLSSSLIKGLVASFNKINEISKQ